MTSIGFEEYDPTIGRTVSVGDPTPPEEQSHVNAMFTGRAGELADLVIRTMMLTILTLGIYRFWMKTNLRRYYWSSIRADDQPLEYTGKGSELFLGFLLAMVILTVYLLIVTFGLTFIGLAVFERPEVASLTALALLPLIPIAIYRARRYLLSRTRWRGIRFGVEAGSWGYTFRYFFFGALMLVSGGLLYPLMQFQLAKFAANRTWFGDLKMTQGGSWMALMLGWIPVLIVGLLGLAAFVVSTVLNAAAIAAADPTAPEGAAELQAFVAPLLEIPQLAALAPYGPLLLLVAYAAYVWYQVYAFRYMTTQKYFGQQEIRFQSKLGFWSVIGIYVTGILMTTLVMLGVILLIGLIVVGGLFATGVGFDLDLAAFQSGASGLENSPIAAPLMAVAAVLGYLILFLVAVACFEVFFTRRLLARACRTLTIFNIERARAARQRRHDSNIEGQGFADALDIGGAI